MTETSIHTAKIIPTRETPKAFCIMSSTGMAFLPKSQVQIVRTIDTYQIQLQPTARFLTTVVVAELRIPTWLKSKL